MPAPVPIAVPPDQPTYKAGDPNRYAAITKAVVDAGGELVEPAAARGLVWLDITGAAKLKRIVNDNPQIAWVQLPWAGVENFAAMGLFDATGRVFTCAKGLFGEQVGEHAVVLTLALLRNLVVQARTRSWLPLEPESLFRRRVTIVGAGGLATTVMKLLVPFECPITVVRRSATATPGASRTVALSELDSVLPETDVLILALPLTAATAGIIGARQLALLPPHSLLINVARGAHVDTAALVAALADNRLGGAGLDVTDPEPLPDDHPLWTLDNVIITSHRADSEVFVTQRLAGRVSVNVRAFAAGTELAGVVDSAAGF